MMISRTLIYRFCAGMLPIALEGLPISSSSHALFFVVPDIPNALDHLAHGPIALLVALYFFNRWSYFASRLLRCFPLVIKIICLGAITETITVVLYGVWSLVGTVWLPVPLGCLVTAVLLFSLRWCPQYQHRSWNVYSAVLLGIAQGMALLPGISRLGSTYVIARWCGIRPQRAFELSFLIEWPISIAGFAKGVFDLHHVNGSSLRMFDVNAMFFGCALGLVGLWYVHRLVLAHRVHYFGWYMVGMALVAFLMGI